MLSNGYSSEAGHGWIPLTICALLAGSLVDIPWPVNAPSCVTITQIHAAPLLNGYQNFTYSDKEICHGQ